MSPLKKCPVCGRLYDSEKGCFSHVAAEGAHSQRMRSVTYPRQSPRGLVQKQVAGPTHPFRRHGSTSAKERPVKSGGLVPRIVNGKEVLVPAGQVIREARKKEERWPGSEKRVVLQNMGKR